MSEAQPSHDAPKTLADLRDHLARHDKPIAFFFGAGTSCAIRMPAGVAGQTKPLIPAVPELTAACKEDAAALGAEYAKAWGLIEAHCAEAGQEPHIENVLSRIRMMRNAIGKDDTLSGLKAGPLKTLEESVRKTIARLVTPDFAGLPATFPHRVFARWLARTSRKTCIEIFTVNYDALIEHALEFERVPHFDGFVGSYQPFFHPDSLRRSETAPGTNWSRLWKMHGSVTWRRIDQDGRPRIIRGAPDPSGEMILPSFHKYDESRQQPYVAFSDRLARFLEQDDALLIVAGFNFGDEHINNLIFGALENRLKTHVFALQYEDPAEDSVLIKRAKQRSNLIVIGPKTGVIGGRRAAWAPSETPSFMNGVFELKEVADAGEGAPNVKSGLMKIGDFACFCHFLESMAS